MDSESMTLAECLSATGLRELPQKIGEDYDKTWLRAICEVIKVGGRREYCLCENDGHGKPIVKRDFGVCAAIVYIVSIHPYEVADKTIVPTFANDAEILHYLTKSRYDRSDIEKLLSTDNKSPEQIERDRSEINRLVNDLALSAQKSKKSEEERVKKIKEFAQAKKAEKEKTKNNGRRKKKENNG